MMNLSKKAKVALFLAAWAASSSLAALVAYWFMGAVPMGEGDPGYLSRLLTVLGDPFGNHFNEFSAFGIAGAVILVTLAFGIAYFVHFAPAPDGSEDCMGLENMEESMNDMPDNDLAFGEPEAELHDNDEAASGINEETYLRLINKGFSNDKIDALLELSEYAPGIGINRIADMVEPTMKVEEIRKYIEAFFG